MSGTLKIQIFSIKIFQTVESSQPVQLYLQLQLGQVQKRSSLLKIKGKFSKINELFELRRESNDDYLSIEMLKNDQGEFGKGIISFQQLIESKQKKLQIQLQYDGNKIGELGLQKEFIADMQSRNNYEEIKKNNQELNSKISMIRMENESLRNKLKQINLVLNKKMNLYLGKKARTNQQYAYLDNEQVIETEIMNAQEQIKQQKIQQKIYIKEQEKFDNLSIKELESNYKIAIKEKNSSDAKVKQIQREIAVVENKLYSLISEDEQQKLEKMNEEIKYYREKQKKLQDQIEQQKKTNVLTQQYSEKLNNKINSICTEKQLDLNQIKKDIYEENEKMYLMQKQQEPIKKQQKQSNQKEDNEIIVNKYEVTKENIEKLKKKYLNYKIWNKKNELAQQHQLKKTEDLQAELEFSLKQIQGKIKEKEKEITLSEQRSQEMRKFVKHNQLSPLDFDVGALTKLQAISSKQLLKACVNQKNKVNKRIARGGIFTENIIGFDDIDFLLDQIPMQIAQIDFFRNEQNTIIYGFQVTYCFDEITNIKKSNLNIDYKLQGNLITQSLKFLKDEYITNITGLSTDTIDYLNIETNKDQIFQIGTIDLKKKSLEFELKTDYMYQPVILFGGLDYKYQNENSENCELALAYIGVEYKNAYFPTKINPRNQSMEEQLKIQQYQNRFRQYLKRKPKEEQTLKEPMIKKLLQIKGNQTLNDEGIKEKQQGSPLKSVKANQSNKLNQLKQVK